ncbi:SDR family NAD(P)-dependent oxidoreductase [Streptomyces sp. NPDC088135]|uniref:SDR family NAD(P)-dependent oxidoreductase n=1 Tax=Streptomyces sp. NPDC088135 TaxID=3160993 RepID=UPI00342170BA
MARAFGRRGFKVGLIARTKVRLEDLVAELAGLGVTAAAFPADIRDHESLTAALAAAESAMGPIDVLEFSPSPTGPITRAAGTTVASATAQFELHVRGAVVAVRHVLPDMVKGFRASCGGRGACQCACQSACHDRHHGDTHRTGHSGRLSPGPD